MRKHSQPSFKLSLLAIALASCAAAQAEETMELAPISVIGNAVPTVVTQAEMQRHVTQDFKQAMKN